MSNIMIGKELKKYTLENYEEFCKDALIIPPFEEDCQLEEWFDTHKVHIIANGCDMELEYDADTINEIEFSLREIHEAILGDGTAATGNTVGSEYRNATWKDILRMAVLNGVYENSSSIKEEINKCINRFTTGLLKYILEQIDTQALHYELDVNFFKLETKDLWKIFDKEERRKAFKQMLCSNIQISELINENNEHDDKVVIIDYSIIPSGDLVGWHYGVDFDKDSEENQHYIQNYIEEMIEND